LYEETKNMTNADAARFVNETARPIAAKYGIKMIIDIPGNACIYRPAGRRPAGEEDLW
jgi:hypothetical protein